MIKKTYLIGSLFLMVTTLVCSEHEDRSDSHGENDLVVANIPALPEGGGDNELPQQGNSAEQSSPGEGLAIQGQSIEYDRITQQRDNRLAESADRRYVQTARRQYMEFLDAIRGREGSVWYSSQGGLGEGCGLYERALNAEFGQKFLKKAYSQFQQQEQYNGLIIKDASDGEDDEEEKLEKFCTNNRRPCTIMIQFGPVPSNNDGNYQDPLPEFYDDEDYSVADLFNDY